MLRRHAAPLLVLLVCLAATALITWQYRQTMRTRDSIRFNVSADRVRTEISSRLDSYIAMLHAGAGLLTASYEVEPDEFRAFVARLELREHCPGIQGIGYSLRIPARDLQRVVARYRAAGQPEFHVWPPGPRDEYHSIVFLEPLDLRNRAAIGYDMFTEAVRRRAMERARDTGRPTASGRVTLVQEITGERQPGFLIYEAVYTGGGIPSTVEERRARLMGFVYSPFRAHDFVDGIFAQNTQLRAAFELYSARPEAASLLYRSAGFDAHAPFTGQRQFTLAGRTWSLAVASTPAIEDAAAHQLTPILALVGLSLTALLTGLTVLQSQARRRLEQSEAELTETSQRFQQLADTIPQLVWTARPDGWIDWYNRRWYEYTGCTLEDMERDGWQRVHDPAELPRVLEQWERALRDGQPFEMEFPLRRADGEWRWFLTRVTPVRNARGQVVRWFGTNTDVQSRRELLDHERALRAEAERIGQIKDEFLATLSHELRTPLNAIIGWTHVLAERPMSEEAQRKALATVQRNARAQARLIEDLLDMSRIISGKVRLEMRNVDLNDITEAAINVVRPTAEAKGVRLIEKLDRTAPLVLGDPARLQQVVWNLLTNAVKFTPQGGRVTLSVRESTRQAELAVEDTGIGVDPAFLPHVFERFRQADGSSTRQHGGLGLGLSIVRSLVEMHGGSVAASSSGTGLGATFKVLLPPSKSQRKSPESASFRSGASGREVLSGLKVLVVDDDQDALELARTILEQHGAIVTTVDSGGEAFDRLNDSNERFDLLVSDLGMPEIDGFELLRRVRARGGACAAIPSVALSAYARDDDRAKAIDAGYATHIAKPFHPSELVAACVETWGRSPDPA